MFFSLKKFQRLAVTSTTTGFILSSILVIGSCGKPRKQVLIDGSSTVYPITEAIAETYRDVEQSISVTVGTSGSGGGFKKFCNGETDISDASRPIKKQEVDACAKAGIEYIELPVAYDGLAVVVNKKNDFIKELTTDQLRKIFAYDDHARTWKDVNPEWPDEEIKIYAPGQDSGTYDYFVETIIGKKGRVRSDATFSEDDNVLVTGVSGEADSIGFFGLAYYEENMDILKVVPIINPRNSKPVEPSVQTVKDGTYYPLSRPLFIYVKKESAEKKPYVVAFVDYYIEHAGKLSKEVGYVPFESDFYQIVKKRFAERSTGSVFSGQHAELKSLDQLYIH